MLERFFPALASTSLDNVVLLVLGLGLLIKGSGLFVQSASSIARGLGVSELVVGLTLVAVGTSLPELVSAIIASLKSEGALVLGNVVGANVANITLIVGGAAALKTMPIAREMLERDGYMALVASALLGVFAFNGAVSMYEGAFLVLLYVAYTLFLVKTSQSYQSAYHISEFARYFFHFKYVTETARTVRNSLGKAESDKSASRSGNPRSRPRRLKRSESWKLAIATRMKASISVTNAWLSERLHMGVARAVSSNCSVYAKRRDKCGIYRKLQNITYDV